MPGENSGTTNPVSQPTRPPPPVSSGSTMPELVRPRRRVIGNTKPNTIITGDVKRNYAVHGGVMFTNFPELKNDTVSAEYAQDILEEVMVIVALDMSNSRATRMFEDVVFTFFVQNAASQKTGYDKVVDIYGVEFDLMVLLRVLVSHGVSPRRFTRGLADRIYDFLRHPDNSALRADLVSKHSLEDPDHAALAFDGSTHITNLSVPQRTLANMLATRGIYENLASVKGASEGATYDGLLTKRTVESGALHKQ